ncbi:hypothetical protein NSE01_09940 [Novosphingobium sediminis]|uniref:Uncharacterized protein n=1 Tax=Novosphingobium sediminis TaxID=707214 RepID=A0A512AHJ5_9SPHN|nr:hypothetical protein NSE01_09940 [Novosphingobium sediminis]
MWRAEAGKRPLRQEYKARKRTRIAQVAQSGWFGAQDLRKRCLIFRQMYLGVTPRKAAGAGPWGSA